MTRATITPVLLDDEGYNLTDSADFETLGTGAGNGVAFEYQPNLEVVLKNTTGGAAVYTFKVPTPTAYSEKGQTLADVTVTVAAAKSWIYKLSSIFKQDTGEVYIDCDVAGDVLLRYK